MHPDRRVVLQSGLGAVLGSMLASDNASQAADVDRAALERYKALARLSLANLATPIEPCERLRKAIPGAPHLYIKRDDCLGYLVGGNKLRKLEYVMADALKKKASAVLTVGGIQ